MSSNQLSPFSFLSTNFSINKDDKKDYLMRGVKLAVLANIVFIVIGIFIRIDLSILSVLLLVPCVITYILLEKGWHEAAIHAMSLGYALGFIASPWLIGRAYAPILIYVSILLIANLVFQSRKVKTLYFLATFLSIYAYVLANTHTQKEELPYVEFIEFCMLFFTILFITNALNIFIVDIKKFRHQLREREVFLDNIINASPDAIFVKNDKFKVVLVNDKFVEIEGRPRETFIGKTATEIQGEFQGYEQVQLEDAEILGGEKQVIGNIVTGMEDGKQLWFEYSKIPIKDEHKNIVGILGTIRNITQKKRQEIALQEKNEQLQKYIESNMQLENFAHIASHDLREPIRSIVSFSQLLKRKAKNKLDKDESEYLDFVISASKNMTALIDDLLAYALINSKKPSYEIVCLESLFKIILQQMHVSIDEKQATIKYDNLPKTIYGNPTQLTQLFQNLISNSIKFSRPNVPPVIAIHAQESGHHWQFEVSDNGIGISPEYHEKIFLLFRRLHTRETYEGTGIGLATCKKIVEQHQGKIWLESNKEQGTTFCFTIHKWLNKKTPIVSSANSKDLQEVS